MRSRRQRETVHRLFQQVPASHFGITPFLEVPPLQLTIADTGPIKLDAVRLLNSLLNLGTALAQWRRRPERLFGRSMDCQLQVDAIQ